MKNYTNFINENRLELLIESNIKYTQDFVNILNSIDSAISKKVLSLSGKEVDVNTNYIDIDKLKNNVILFKPDDKVNNSNTDVVSSEMNVGRFIRHILLKSNIEFSNIDIEDFVNKFKSAVQISKDGLSRFKVVKGTEIRRWYLEDNYYDKSSGSLGSSCMKYAKCQDYFEIYERNSENVSMIILTSKDDVSKISGRALLFTDIKERRFMDRAYVSNYSDEALFIDYAISNNFIYKNKQDYNNNTPLFLNGKELSEEDSVILVPLKNIKYKKYPYLDTLKYLDKNTIDITNKIKVNNIEKYYLLNSVNGSDSDSESDMYSDDDMFYNGEESDDFN
jgi:hypothetical protein